jgi:N-acetylmuramoyl-L-alanine amidase
MRARKTRRRRRRLRLIPVMVVVAIAVLAGTSSAARRIADAVVEHLQLGAGVSGPQAIDPARFSEGACVAYGSTEGDRHETVFLDAGHGGRDPGAVGATQSGQTIYEADETLPVELDTLAILRRHGFRVVVSRTRAESVVRLTAGDVSGRLLTLQGVHDDVAARDVCANDAGANLLVGIYFDSGGPGDAGSVTGYDADRPFAAANLRLATLLQDDVLRAMDAQGWQIPDEGVQPDDQLGSAVGSDAISYGHLLLLGPAKPGWFETPSRMPGAVIEPLFVTDPFEASIAASARGQRVIAGGLAQAIEQYFSARKGRRK